MNLRISIIDAYPDLLLRLCFIYAVALFDGFVSDVLQILLTSKPEAMRSSKKQLSYESILRILEKGDLISFMAEREINEFGYKAIQDQAQYCQDRFGINLEESGVAITRLSEIRAVRNLLVHSAGIVNSIYLDIVPSSVDKIGEGITLAIEEVQSASNDLFTAAKFLHRALIEKFV